MKKQPTLHFNLHGTHALSLALCTVMGLSVPLLRADDTDQKADQRGTGASKSESRRSGQLNRQDEKFVRDAARGGQMEVHMGKLGVQKAQNEQVKQFAQKLIDDHTKANQELKQIASSKGITLPDSADEVAGTGRDTDRSRVREKSDAEAGSSRQKVRDRAAASGEKAGNKAEMQKLHSLSGTDFDREFVRMAVTDHEKDVKEFEKASQKLDDAELKSFAQKTLPTLREHLQQARGLQAQVGGTTGSSTATPGANTTGETPAPSSGVKN